MTYESPYIQGWKRPEELTFLFEIAKRFVTIAEIGSWRGRGTHALCSGCSGTVTAIDPWDTLHYGRPELKAAEGRDIFAEFQENMKGFTNLRIWRMASEDVRTDEKFEMVFLDARKTYEAYVADITRWLPRTTKLIAGYDYHNVKPVGVERAVRDTLGAVNFFGNIWTKQL